MRIPGEKNQKCSVQPLCVLGKSFIVRPQKRTMKRDVFVCNLVALLNINSEIMEEEVKLEDSTAFKLVSNQTQ